MEQKTSSNANTSLVLGIISLVCGVLGFFRIAGIVTGIVGIVLSHKIRAEEQAANTGFILSIIGLVISSLGFLFILSISLFPFFWFIF